MSNEDILYKETEDLVIEDTSIEVSCDTDEPSLDEIMELEGTVESIQNEDMDCLEEGEAFSDTSDMVRFYYKEISKYHLLSAEEEITLARLVKNGDKMAKDLLATHNLRLVVSIAKRYINTGIPLLDLIQEGNIGLLTAIDRYNPEKGYRFSTYATWWIRQAVSRSVVNTKNHIRIPVHLYDRLAKFYRAKNEFIQVNHRDPSKDEEDALLDECSLNRETYNHVCLIEDPVSINTKIGDEGDTELGDFIEDSTSDLEQEGIRSITYRQLEEVLKNSSLTKKEFDVLCRRVGFYSNQPETLETIAKDYGVTRERIRQIESKAIRKCKVGRTCAKIKAALL